MIGESFIRNLGVIIIVAAAFSIVARGLRMPSIVAYLAAGLVLGPATGLVRLTVSLELISEVGIALLLFLVGLELSFEKIRGMGRPVLAVGGGQMGLTAIGAGLLAWLLGFDGKETLFLAIALTFSSTVVAVKLLDEKQESSRLHGRIAVGVLLFQDLAVILVLTLLVGFEAGAAPGAGEVALSLAKALGGMGAMIGMVWLAARYLLPGPFAWVARSPPALLIWSLCWCFFVVVAAHALHLSPETGAFVAGVSLAQLPYNRDLRRRLSPLMNFFMAVFFVSLGIKMELGVVTTHWVSVLAFTGFVLVGKFLMLYGLLARMRFGEWTAQQVALTLSQVSEFSFIFLAAGVRGGWVGEQIMSVVGVVGLATFSASAFGIVHSDRISDWLSGAGWLRKIFGARSEGRPAAETPPRHGHVIVVGMNTLGRTIARRLHERGERVLAIDTDLTKLSGLGCETILGNVEYLSVLEESDLRHARLLVSALRIEPTNDLLAYRCRRVGVPCSIHVVDLSVVDNLLEMDVRYLMIPKVDGIKLQVQELKRRNLLKA